jgi:hypothetical protein
MASPSPYYRTKEELEALTKLRDSFGDRFAAPPPRNITVVIVGTEGQGKTHLTCSIAGDEYGPLYLGDSEHRAQIVVDKFQEMGRPVQRATLTTYQETVAFVSWAKQNVKRPAVIGLDSGTDIDKFAEEQYLIHEDKEVVGKPINHPRMQRYIFKLLDDLKFSGFTVVMTAKMKDEYVGENRTGKKLPRIFRDIPYRADLVIEIQGGKCFITKSGWTQKQLAEIPQSITTLPDMIAYAKTLDTLPTVVTPNGTLVVADESKNNGTKKIIGR